MGIRNDKNGRIRRIRRMAMCGYIYGYLWLSDFHNLLGFESLSQTWDEFRSDSHLLDQMFPTAVRSCCISISEFLGQCGNPPLFGMIIRKFDAADLTVWNLFFAFEKPWSIRCSFALPALPCCGPWGRRAPSLPLAKMRVPQGIPWCRTATTVAPAPQTSGWWGSHDASGPRGQNASSTNGGSHTQGRIGWIVYDCWAETSAWAGSCDSDPDPSIIIWYACYYCYSHYCYSYEFLLLLSWRLWLLLFLLFFLL